MLEVIFNLNIIDYLLAWFFLDLIILGLLITCTTIAIKIYRKNKILVFELIPLSICCFEVISFFN